MSEKAARSTKTTCPYCGVGCGVLATPLTNGGLDIKGDPDHPANFGRLCSKGAALGQTVSLDGRLLDPWVNGKTTNWNHALQTVADRFSATIAEHGPDSVAFYVSGQLLTEDYYVANKLMKGFIGSANIDTNSRLCMASSVAGHKRAFGSDTVPGTYEDLELADVIVLVGSNLAWCHPVLYQRIAAAKAHRPDMKIIVIDPRRTMTMDIADLHLPLNPDSDTALFNALLLRCAQPGVLNQRFVAAHTSGFEDALAAAKADSDPEKTGLSDQALEAFFDLFVRNERVVTVYSQGVNQSSAGTDKVNAIINCHLATGRIGKPGMGPFSATGQPNAMGGREVGGLANMLAAHMELANPVHTDRVQRFWQSPRIADRPGLKAVELFNAIADGRVKALWIMATNPVVSMPDAARVEAAIAQCPFVVVSDVVSKTDTLRHAHVKLPSLAWAEKSGTVTNSERRISRQRGILPAPGQAKADWWQLANVAQRMGFAGFDYVGPSAIFAEHAQLSAFENDGSRDFDIGAYGAVSADAFDALEPFQWPAPKSSPAEPSSIKHPEKRFFADGRFFTQDGKANFVAVQSPAPRHYGLRLNTGRVRDHWHTMTRTGRSPRNSAHMAEPYCEIHPDDAAELGIDDACLVKLFNAQGDIIVRTLLSLAQKRGHVFVPMHWNDQWASNARVDKLVSAVTDPVSGQPALKGSSVFAEPFSVARFGFMVSRNRPDLSACAYFAVAQCEGGWRTEFALSDTADLGKLVEPFGAADVDMTGLGGDTRRVWVDGARLSAAVFLAAEPVLVSRSFLCDQLAADRIDPAQAALLAAGRPAVGTVDKGALVCSCFGVGANEIATAIEGGCQTVQAVGRACQAGTNCGSCKSEISQILSKTKTQTAGGEEDREPLVIAAE
ncbi:MAG: nitrate reductase [Pseudomonadota bacterium]